MKVLRYSVAIPAILVLGVFAFVLALPYAMYGISVRLCANAYKLVCWAAGRHVYDVYSALMLDDLSILKCTCCATPIPQDKLAEIIQQRDDLKTQITLVAQYVKETQANKEISEELSKLEE